jgi:hypothetical protein
MHGQHQQQCVQAALDVASEPSRPLTAVCKLLQAAAVGNKQQWSAACVFRSHITVAAMMISALYSTLL